jgi:asparagine synthase (glutamine-hydrolysing)
MSANVHLTSLDWQEKSDGRIKQRGTCWPDCDALLQAGSTHAVSNTLKLQNGFYTLVWENSDTLYAAVDHIRSIPLFYALKGSDFYLSDDADWVREQVGNTEIDEIAKEEFQLTGYVTGQDTLYPDVKQLQAGEFLCINTLSESPKVETERYYRFLHTEPDAFDEHELLQQLDDAALASIDNLIRYANGRQIVIPLSGGYDSRLIATLLKRRGYENILCFTYGVPGNKESAYSKMVADALGLKWHFVEYSNELWREAWQTEERWQYQKWGSGWSSIPHVQDWLAVKYLKQESVVEADCIFVPGHTGDFISGGHVPESAIKDKSSTSQELFEAINNKHYSLAPVSQVTKRSQLEWSVRILGRAEQATVLNGQDMANAFEKWEWQERQAKFICNSVRVYEFFGYDWWLPLWDMEFVRFWQTVPLEVRKGREWYVDYVSCKFNEAANPKLGELENATDKPRVMQYLRSLYLSINVPHKEKIKNYIKSKISRKGALSSSGRYPDVEYSLLTKRGYSSNGVYAYFFLVDARDRRS